MSDPIIIGIADLNVAKDSEILVTYALGSCVGICLYDSVSRIAGLAHVMLPFSAESKDSHNKAKFADTAIIELINKMELIGANRHRLIAKIAGGAQMFEVKSQNETFHIGKRNILATKKILETLNIQLVAEDIGSDYGRTIEFFSNTGVLRVKSISKGVIEI